MSDGPACMPLDKYFRHSRIFYKDSNINNLVAKKYQQHWNKALQYHDKNAETLIKLSDDNGRSEVGIKVLPK